MQSYEVEWHEQNCDYFYLFKAKYLIFFKTL